MKNCIGDPEANADNPVLKAEQDAQVKIFSFLFVILFYLVHLQRLEVIYHLL
jgi:hypothetical protein